MIQNTPNLHILITNNTSHINNNIIKKLLSKLQLTYFLQKKKKTIIVNTIDGIPRIDLH